MFRIVTMCYGSETPFLGVRNRLIFPSNLSCSLSLSCFVVVLRFPVGCPCTLSIDVRFCIRARGVERGYSGFQLIGIENRKYFMESAGVRYLRTSC